MSSGEDDNRSEWFLPLGVSAASSHQTPFKNRTLYADRAATNTDFQPNLISNQSDQAALLDTDSQQLAGLQSDFIFNESAAWKCSLFPQISSNDH